MIWPGHLWGLLNTLTTISALSLKGIIKSQYFVTGASIDLSVVNRYTSLWLRLRTLDPASLQRHTHTIWTLQSFLLSHYQDNVWNIHVLTNPVHGEWKISLQINSSFLCYRFTFFERSIITTSFFPLQLHLAACAYITWLKSAWHSSYLKQLHLWSNTVPASVKKIAK